MSAAEAAEEQRLQGRQGPVLLWLAWRFLPPTDRADQRVLTWTAAACAYTAVPLTVAIADQRLPLVTLLSLVCLAVPGLPVLWLFAVPLGARRRGTALALRQARLDPRRAGLASAGRLLAYPAIGACVGAALIAGLHRVLVTVLPAGAPLSVAIHASAGRWLLAAPFTVVALAGLTALLSSARSAELFRRTRALVARITREHASPAAAKATQNAQPAPPAPPQ